MSMMRVHSSEKVASKSGSKSSEGHTLGAVYSGKEGYFSATVDCCEGNEGEQFT